MFTCSIYVEVLHVIMLQMKQIMKISMRDLHFQCACKV